VIGSWASVPIRLLRRPVLVRVAAVGATVVLVACGGPSTRSTASPKKRKTVVSSTTTTTPPAISYQVKPGDTLTSIARFFGVSPALLAAANHVANADQLTVGQVLQVPPHPPVQLMVTPSDAQAGQSFTLNLTGAQAGETVTFEIDAPGGGRFTGPPHTAATDGSVNTNYQTSPTDPPGTYTAVATGDHGTSARATFRVDPYSPST
jgi:LysM repeat protein